MSVLQVIVSLFTALAEGDGFDPLFPFKLALTALVCVCVCFSVIPSPSRRRCHCRQSGRTDAPLTRRAARLVSLPAVSRQFGVASALLVALLPLPHAHAWWEVETRLVRALRSLASPRGPAALPAAVTLTGGGRSARALLLRGSCTTGSPTSQKPRPPPTVRLCRPPGESHAH